MNKFLVFCFMVVISGSIAYGQAASATWAIVSDGNGVVTGNVAATAQAAMGGCVAATKCTWGCVVSVPGQATTAVGLTSPITSNYVQYAVAPTTGNSFTVSSVTMYLGFSGSNNGAVEIDYSVDGTTFSALTTSLLLPSSNGLANSLSFTVPTNSNNVASGKSFILNLYPWFTGTGSAGTGKYMTPRNIVVSGTTSGSSYVEDEGTTLAPKKLTLENYPNPFNPSTNIRFTVKESGVASVKVYNVLGKLVATLYNGQVQAGEYKTVSFGGNNYASGIYYYTINSTTGSLTKKMLLMK
jgi:hypothetical protein